MRDWRNPAWMVSISSSNKVSNGPFSECLIRLKYQESETMQRAKLAWFGLGRENDARYLDLWRAVRLSYQIGQPTDSSFHNDQHETVIAPKSTPRSFGHAAELLLRYQFYPSALMHHVSDFSRENRTMRPGDRIIQRINPLALVGLPFSI